MASEFAEKLKALNSICESEEDNALSSSVLKNWLEGQAVSPVVLWKDQYGKVTGAGIDLVCNRVCPQYFNTGFHVWPGHCQRLHVCKQFLEGSCDGKCRRSHDFFDKFNRERTKRFGLDNFPNKLIRRIVCYSLPQVCLLYLKSKCTSDDCPYLHICARVVGQESCDCPLLHNNVDLSSHNKTILERHGLFLERSKGITDFALWNILVPVEQKHFKARKDSFEVITHKMPSSSKSFPLRKTKSSIDLLPTCSELVSEPDDKPTRLTLSAKQDRGVKSVEHQKRKQMYPTTGSPSATQDPKSIPQLVSKADVPRYPNSHSVDKGNKEIEPNQQEEKVPLNTSESSLTPQASKSIPKIPRKEAVVQNQKKDKTPPRTSDSSTSQVANSIPGVVSVTDDILSHLKSPHSLDIRKEGVERNQNKEKIQPSKIGSRMALQWSKRVPKMNPELHSSHNLLSIDNEREAVEGRQKKKKKPPNSLESSLTSHDSQATPERLEIQSGRDVFSHPNSYSIENGRATVKGNQKIETTPSSCSNSSFTLQVSKRIPGIPSVTDDVPAHANPHSAEGQQKNDKTPPSSPGSSLTPRVSKDIPRITGVTVDVRSHPHPYSINKGEEADEPNQKNKKIPLSSSERSSTSQVSNGIPEIRDVTDNVLTYPNPNSVEKEKETAEGLQENENKCPTSSASSLNLPQVSEGIPGITGVAFGVSGPSPHSIIKEKEAVKPNQKNQKIPVSYWESRLSSQVSKSILRMPGVTVAGRSHRNPHSIGKGKAAVNPNQKNEKIPPSSSDSTLTSQVFKSVPEIPGNVSSYPNPYSVDKGKEEGEEQQKNDKTPPSSSDSSLTFQVSKTIPGTLRVTVGVPCHPNPLFINKGKDAVKPNQTNEKTHPSSLDSSVTSQVSKNITGMPDVTCDGPSHTSPLSINKRKGAFELNEKNEKMPPGSSDSSLASQLSQSVPSNPSLYSIDKKKAEAEGQQENEKTPPGSSDSGFNSPVSKDIPGITGVTVGVPSHPDPHSIRKERGAVEPNQKYEKKPPRALYSSFTSQISNSVSERLSEDDIISHPNPSSSDKGTQDLPQGPKKGESPLKVSDIKETEEHNRNIDKAEKLPANWCPMAPKEQYKRVELDPNSTEFRDVETLFRKTMETDVSIIATIERVQNPFLWEKYCRKKENMVDSAVQKTEESPLNAANEKQLFHGTSPDVVDAICKQNFDWRKSGKNATKYGDGSYFADNARFSSQYAKMDEECYYFIFLAKVLVGSYTVGKPDYRRPPPREPSNPASDLYDSCVDRIHNPTIFVVFDIDQYYPEYIIKFLKLDSSVASQASSTNTVKQPPSSNSKFQKPTTTTGNHRIKSTNIGVSGQRLKANKELASSAPNRQQQPSKTPGNSQAKSAKTGASSHNLRSVPSTSTPNLQQAISAAKNPRRHSVDSGMLGLRSKRGKRFNAKLKKSRCLIQ